MASSAHVSPDSYSRNVEDSIILLSSDSKSSDINDIEKLSSILQKKNATESVHKPRDETDDLARDHHEIATHATTTPRPSSPVILNIPEHLNQPMHFKFPQWQFEKKKIVKRSFQSQCFNKWQWLHYDETQDLAFCHVCATAGIQEKWLTQET